MTMTRHLEGRLNSTACRLSLSTLMLVLLGVPGLTHPARAESGRLGRHVVPVSQAVHLRIDPDQSDYSGSVVIRLAVREATRSFDFHAEEMSLDRLVLLGQEGPIEATHERSGNALVTVTASEQLMPGEYTLEIEFTNDFGTKAVGLYRMEQDGRGYVFTQFEPDDAREAFPCFDEPGFKLPWQLTLEVPEDDVAVTNTPSEQELSEGGWRRSLFQPTQPLPSYLIAIAVGPLQHTPIPGLSIPANVVTIQGQDHLTSLAAEMTPPILAALEDYFGSPYPFEKLDLIAIPEYWPGAMEHPGAVTFAAPILLIDPQAASTSQRRTLARVIAHELAHMWFGNLVTMEWWDDLWLNEAFADWMGDKITNRVYPQYNLDVTELQSIMQVMTGDARPSTQAVRQPVKSTDNLMQNVGTQYNKGKAVLAMFEQWIGEEDFRRGVLNYLRAHHWQNAEAADFWRALTEASGNNVTSAMGTFIEQPGLPLVSVDLLGDNKIRLRQKRFANHNVEQPEEYTWKIPVALKYSDGERTNTKMVLLEESAQTVSLDTRGRPEWVLPNADQSGYYRWEVSQEILASLARNATTVLNERERVGLMANLSALLDAGIVGGDDYLSALGQFADDPKPMVISSLLSALGKVEMAFIPQELEQPFSHYVVRTLGPALERFGLDARAGEDEEVALFRPQLLRWLGDRGQDPRILAHAQDLATMYMQDPASIDASLAGVALSLAAMHGDRALFDEYRTRFESAQVPADRGRYLGALSHFRDPELIQEALRYTLEGPLRPNELFTIPGGIMSHPANRDLVFEWFKEQYDAIATRVPPTFMGYMPFIASGCSATRLETARIFFSEPGHQVAGTSVQLAKVSDQVTDCVGLREREGDAVAAYLTQLVGQR